MTTLAERKAALRGVVFARRKQAFETREAAVPAATARLLQAIGEPRDRIIAGYRPIRTELDPTPAMTALAAQGARLCVPVIEAAGRPLLFREWTPGCEMTKGPFGAEVPADGDWLEPEILITPLVGFDRMGWRIGYGGGFYDRSLKRLRARRPTQAIGFAYAAQELTEAPQEPTDQRLDMMVTEAETLRFN